MDTPCPYKIEFLNVSPFYKEGRTERQMIKLAQEQESIYLTGAKIPFTYVSSLKSMASVNISRPPRLQYLSLNHRPPLAGL